jgi:hypothetical protein
MATDSRQNNLVKIIEAAGKRKAAENQFKTELMKLKVQSEFRKQEKLAASKQDFAMNLVKEQAQERMKNPQQYSPEQQYLRRRFMQENPLASLSIPEEGDVQPGQGLGIGFPKDEVVQDPKTKMLSAQPLTGDRQAQLLTTRVDQMLAEGKKPHPAILAIAQKMRDNMKLKVEGAVSKEQRLQKQQQLNNVRMYGGEINDEQMKTLGVDMHNYAKAGGAVRVLGKDGKPVWEVMPYESFKTKVAQGKWAPAEIKDFQASVVENNQWKNVLKVADELGIGEKDMQYLGEIEFDPINTPYGTFSIPARFNTFAQYAKDPKYTGLKRQIETAFQAFRKRVTGAQAGEKELVYLRQIMPDLKDRPEVFFTVIKQLMKDNVSELNAKLEAYKAFGRDTSQLEVFMTDKFDVDGSGSEGAGDDDTPEGTVINNPTTGERMILENGEWKPYEK